MQLQLHGVGKRYEDSDEVVLNDISLTVEQGEFVCVVGKSGCGKSTLLKLIAGLEAPSYGQMLLNGKPITKPGADRVVMFQEHALFPWLTVEENVKFGMKLAGASKRGRRNFALSTWIWSSFWIIRNTGFISSLVECGKEWLLQER